MFGDAGQIELAHRRPDIEACQIEADRRAAGERELPLHGIEILRRREDHAGPCPPRERDDVDLELREPIVAGDEARDHARVDGDGSVEYDDEAHIRRRIHRPAPQHLHVRVATSDQHDGGSDPPPAGSAPPTRALGRRLH